MPAMSDEVWIWGFLSSHLNTSRICEFVVNVWADGGSEELEWGCGNDLEQAETGHDDVMDYSDCISSYTRVEQQTCSNCIRAVDQHLGRDAVNCSITGQNFYLE